MGQELISTAATREWQALFDLEFKRERSAFLRLLPDLVRKCKGQFVALCGGEVVGYSQDELSLAKKVAKQFPHKFVLIQEVSDNSQEDAI